MADGAMLETRVSLGWRHAFADLPAARLPLAGGGAFTVTGVPIARDALALQAGIDLAIGQASRLGFTYDGQFASGAMENAFKANFSTRF
ncbi:autotransporter domain-containing protein [Mesorhizobium sp. 43Arga]